MSRVPTDDEAQRGLEQRALENVGWLAAKLGYRDAMDRRTEKRLVLAIAAGLVLLIAGFLVSGAFKARRDEEDLARHRCEVAAYVEVLPEMETRVKARQGDLTRERQAEMARSYASDEALARCRAGDSKK